jgi:hypothetical protein
MSKDKTFRNNMTAKLYASGQPEEFFDWQIASALLDLHNNPDAKDKVIDIRAEDFTVFQSYLTKHVDNMELPHSFLLLRFQAFQKANILREKIKRQVYEIVPEKINTLEQYQSNLLKQKQNLEKFLIKFNALFSKNTKEKHEFSLEELFKSVQYTFYREHNILAESGDYPEERSENIKSILELMKQNQPLSELVELFYRRSYCYIIIDCLTEKKEENYLENKNFFIDGVLFFHLCGYKGKAQKMATEIFLKELCTKKANLWISPKHIEEFEQIIRKTKNDLTNIPPYRSEDLIHLISHQFTSQDLEVAKNEVKRHIIPTGHTPRQNLTWYIRKYEKKSDISKVSKNKVNEKISKIRSQLQLQRAEANYGHGLELDIEVLEEMYIKNESLSGGELRYILLTPNDALLDIAKKALNNEETFIEPWGQYQIRAFFNDLENKIDSHDKLQFLSESLSVRFSDTSVQLAKALKYVMNEANESRKHSYSSKDSVSLINDEEIEKRLSSSENLEVSIFEEKRLLLHAHIMETRGETNVKNIKDLSSAILSENEEQNRKIETLQENNELSKERLRKAQEEILEQISLQNKELEDLEKNLQQANTKLKDYKEKSTIKKCESIMAIISWIIAIGSAIAIKNDEVLIHNSIIIKLDVIFHILWVLFIVAVVLILRFMINCLNTRRYKKKLQQEEYSVTKQTQSIENKKSSIKKLKNVLKNL